MADFGIPYAAHDRNWANWVAYTFLVPDELR